MGIALPANDAMIVAESDAATDTAEYIVSAVVESAPGYTGARTPPERALAVQILRSQGIGLSETARVLQMDERTVKAIEKRADMGSTLARLMLQHNALGYVQQWQQASEVAAAKGRHEPARDALIYAGVVQKAEDSTPKVQMTVQLNGGAGPVELQADASGRTLTVTQGEAK